MTITASPVTVAALSVGSAAFIIALTAAVVIVLPRMLRRPDDARPEDAEPSWWPEFERELEAWKRDTSDAS